MATNTTVTIHGTPVSSEVKNAPKSKKRKNFGLGFPIGGKLQGGFFTKSSGVTLAKGNLKQLLLTEKGQRIMLPNYGCNLRRFLFQPLDQETFSEIKHEVLTSIARYAPNIIVRRLRVYPQGTDSNTLVVSLLIQIQDLDNAITEVEVSI